MARNEILGMKELERTFRELGKVPQTTATKSARAGASIALKAAKANAPVDTGALREGIILHRERRTKLGKAVYDVMMDPAMNDIFQKKTKTGLRRRGNQLQKGNYYYPASQEYGFLTIDGGYVPGYHFLKRAITEHDTEIERKVLETAAKDVEKALRG